MGGRFAKKQKTRFGSPATSLGTPTETWGFAIALGSGLVHEAKKTNGSQTCQAFDEGRRRHFPNAKAFTPLEYRRIQQLNSYHKKYENTVEPNRLEVGSALINPPGAGCLQNEMGALGKKGDMGLKARYISYLT